MLRLIRTGLVFGLGAVAIAATTFAPAHAAESQQSLPKFQQFLFKPDIRLLRRQFTETSTVTTFNWKIENIGAADSGPITVKATCRGYAIDGTALVVNKVIPGLKLRSVDLAVVQVHGGPGGLGSHGRQRRHPGRPGPEQQHQILGQ